jgi:dolichol kinase
MIASSFCKYYPLIQSLSRPFTWLRSGAKSEALGGPLIYTIVLLLGTFLFFRGSPIGVVAIIQMAAGDGIADIIGR